MKTRIIMVAHTMCSIKLRDLISADELMQMTREKCMIVMAGQRSIQAKKFD